MVVFPKIVMEGVAGGVKALAVGEGGRLVASGVISGIVRVERDKALLWESSVEPTTKKSQADGFLGRVMISACGGLLYVSSGLDVAAFEVETGRLVWEYVFRRTFGFLRTSPLDMVEVGEDLLVSGSSGVLVRLDRKGREVYRVDANDAPESMALVAGDRVWGTEGSYLHAWDVETGAQVGRWLAEGRFYGLAGRGDGKLVAVRGAGFWRFYEVEGVRVVEEFGCGPGLPVGVFGEGGRFAWLEDGGVRVRGSGRVDFAGARVLSLVWCGARGGWLAGCSDGMVRTVVG